MRSISKRKKTLFLVFFITLIFSCKNSIDELKEEENQNPETTSPQVSEESKIPEDETSPSEEVPQELTITLQPGLTVVSKNQKATLTCAAECGKNPVTYQWYTTSDGTTEKGIAATDTDGTGAQTNSFTTTTFTEKEIRYYYCVATSKISDTETQTVTSNVIAAAYTGLPIVIITTDDNTMPSPSKEKHEGKMQIIRNGETIYDTSKIEGTSKKFSIKVRGNATAGYPKRPYKLKLPEKANLLDTTAPYNSTTNKDKNWVLLAGYCDKTLLRTKTGFFTASLFNELESNEQLYVPHSEFVDLIINGEYLGNYVLTDSVKEGSDRLPVNEKATDNGGIGFVAEFDGGYYAREPKWFKSSIKEYPYTFKFPDTDDTNFDTYMSDFENYINCFESAFYDTESTDDWKNYIDIESFARWFLIHNILANIDTNYFMSKKTSDDSSKLIMGPVWDFEWSIGIGWYEGSRPRDPDYWCVNGWYFSELLEREEFKSELKNQWNKLLSAYPDLSSTINNKMDEWASEIQTSQGMNFKKWDILNKRVSVGGVPLGSYEAELECDKQFITSRIQWLDNAINIL